MAVMRTTMGGKNKRLDISEEKNSELEEITIKIIKNETQNEKRINKNEQSLSEQWANYMWPNIYVIKILETEGLGRRNPKSDRRKDSPNFFELQKNCMRNTINSQIQEAQQTP